MGEELSLNDFVLKRRVWERGGELPMISFVMDKENRQRQHSS